MTQGLNLFLSRKYIRISLLSNPYTYPYVPFADQNPGITAADLHSQAKHRPYWEHYCKVRIRFI